MFFTDKQPLWGVPLWVNITYDGYVVGDVYHTAEEAEQAKNKSPLRLQTIRIQ